MSLSHLDVAHRYWKSLVTPGDTVIDATCGHGHDTLVLACLALTEASGFLYAVDIQSTAIASCRTLITQHLPKGVLERIYFIEGCHSQFPPAIRPESVQLIVYNLGYLPKGDKSKTTMTATTRESLMQAQTLVKQGGTISIMCYPGHPEGEREEAHLLEYAATLPSQQWACCHHRWLNYRKAPSLLLMKKAT